MPLAMANLLKIPIVAMTQMENLPVLPVTLRESLQCLPIFVAFDHSGAGHYDAVDHIANNQPSSVTHPPSSQKHAPSIECCRCGQGGRKRTTFPPVIALGNGASVFKVLKAAVTNANAKDVKTHMEKGGSNRVIPPR